MSKGQKFLVLAAIVFLNGCTFMPKYTRPPSSIPSNLPKGEAYLDEKSLKDAQAVAGLKWQDVFLDKRLQKVIEISLINNLDLRLAVLKVERARGLYGVQRAELFPAVTASGAGSKQRVPASLSSTGKEATVEQYSVDLGILSWEVDLFGRIRSLKQQALEEYFATEEAQHAARTALISEVARAYFVLAADLEKLKLAQATFEAQENVHKLIKQHYDNGIVNELDLRRSQTQVDAARGASARYEQFVAQDQNTLNFLAGSSLPDDLIPADLSSVVPVKDIIAGASSEVLLRRPDIMEAEHHLKAAYALIGAARAAFFPSISLTTTLGTASNDLSGLFKSGSSAWSFAPQSTMPIFDARTYAAYKVSEVTRQISVVQYEKTIQAAFKEVADALAVRGTIDQQLAAQQSIVDSEQKIYELSLQRYKQGIDDYLNVLDAQRTLYAAQQDLTSLRLAKQVNQARIYNVLGGDGEPESVSTSGTTRE